MSARWLELWWLALWLAACRPVAPPTPRSTPPAPTSSAAVIAPVAPPEPALAPKPTPSLLPLATPVCSVSAPTWSGELRLRPGGAPFARISRGPAVIALGGAAHDGISLAAVESAELRILGVVDQPNLYLTRPTLLSKMVVPHASTPVVWHETTTPNRVLISVDVSDVFESPKAVEAAVGCEALTGTEPSFDARAFAAPASQRLASLTDESTLVAGLGEAAGARFTIKPTRWVEVVASQGAMTRVVIDTERYVAVGWLPTAMLGVSRVVRPPTVRMGATQYRGTGDRRCAHDIALIASVAGERAFVGTLPAGASFKASTLDVEPGFVELTLFEPWLHVLDEAELLMRESDLIGC